MLQFTIPQNLRIQLILLLIDILHCQHHILLYLSVLIPAKHCSKLYHRIQCQCSFMAACSTVTFKQCLHVKSSCALAVESHPSHDPAETKSTRSGHFLLSFDIRAQFPWEERAACLFCWGLFHFTLEKETINIVLPYIICTDSAGIARRWKEKVHYCHPSRWHMKLSLDACFE